MKLRFFDLSLSVCRFEPNTPFPAWVTGALSSIATPLADAGIGIFAVSTYDTDYLLLREGDRARAREILADKL